MARKKIVAGNWKMNKTIDEGVQLAKAVAGGKFPARVSLVLCTPFVNLQSVQKVIARKKNIHLGAQNMHPEAKGAFTGEISAEMLHAVGASFVILGHSERRQYFHESDEFISRKVKSALQTGITPIFCCGEPLEMRQAGKHIPFVENQLQNALFSLTEEEISKIVIAYEPIWAIGTGLTASPDQAQEMHAAIRKLMKKRFGNTIAKNISILYGGSCNAKNAKELFALADVDGGLIGGASLIAEDFLQIANSF
ncbi:MAG: triose-phosphate isomerase [Saprospiraceae bacterium]